MAVSDPFTYPEKLRWIIAQEGSRQTYGIPLAFHRLGALRMMYDVRGYLVPIWAGLVASGKRRNPGIVHSFSSGDSW